MLSWSKCLLLFLLPLPAWADLTIFDVRKNLAMSDADPVYRDYIINGGSEAGLSVGMVVTVQRRMPLYDSYQNRSAGDLQLKVAKIKIIHVQKGLSVARLQSEFTREATPVLEDNFIMVGDRIDLASATNGGGDKKADIGDAGAPAAQAPAPAAPPAAAPPQPVASAVTKPAANIMVNSTDQSSQSKPNPLPPKVDAPILQ